MNVKQEEEDKQKQKVRVQTVGIKYKNHLSRAYVTKEHTRITFSPPLPNKHTTRPARLYPEPLPTVHKDHFSCSFFAPPPIRPATFLRWGVCGTYAPAA